MTKVLSMVNLKGGTGKTTTTAHIAQAYAELGFRVLIVDADPQASILQWSATAGWDIPVIGQPVPRLNRLLPGIIGDRFDIVVIDTPPLDEKAGIVYGAIRAADLVLIPMAPTTMEVGRLEDVWNAIEEASSTRNDDIESAVLLNRTIANAASTDSVRRFIEDGGHRVLQTTIPRREAIAQSLGAPITKLYGYDVVVAELEKKEVATK